MRNIIKQSSWLFFAQAAARGVSFFYTLFLAQNLGVSDFGIYTVALTYFSLAATLADFGFNRFLIREIARDEYKASELLFSTTLLRLTVASVFFALFAVLLYVFDADKFRVYISILAILAILPQSIALSFDAVFVATKRLQYSAFSLVCLSIITALLGVTFVYKGIFGIILALIIGQIIYVGILYLLLKSQNIQISRKSNFKVLKEVLIGSMPYGLLGVLGFMYFKVDTLMLTYMKGNYDTGIYGVAYKFLEGIIFVPSAVGTALFPVMAQLQQHTNIATKHEVYALYLKGIRAMLIISIPFFLLFMLVLPVVITTFLPQYQQSLTVLKVLAFTIPWMFMGVPQSALLLSSDKNIRLILLISVFNLLLNVVGNLIFIPAYSFNGAAWITVITDMIGFFIFTAVIKILYTRKI